MEVILKKMYPTWLQRRYCECEGWLCAQLPYSSGKSIHCYRIGKKMLAENQKQRAHKLQQLKAEAQDMADKMRDVSLTIGAKTSSTGTIFGSVTNIQIADALKEKGFEIDRKIIVIKGPVKEVGNYTAVVKLHKEVTVEIPFEVISE